MLALYGDGKHDGAGGIAWHFDQAGERRKAAPAYIDAGIFDLELRDFDSARLRFERVGELGVHDDEPLLAAQALTGLGHCAYGEGESVTAAEYFERAHDLARRERVPELVANNLISMGWIDYNAGRMGEGAKARIVPPTRSSCLPSWTTSTT